jgi:hypothetical protein
MVPPGLDLSMSLAVDHEAMGSARSPAGSGAVGLGGGQPLRLPRDSESALGRGVSWILQSRDIVTRAGSLPCASRTSHGRVGALAVRETDLETCSLKDGLQSHRRSLFGRISVRTGLLGFMSFAGPCKPCGAGV